jgi:hypothetical protein
LHNTIANNTGGGILVSGNITTATLRGNIIVSNTSGGVLVASTQGVVSSDFDNVWNNTFNYSGLPAGPNSISGDPLFAGPSNYHLARSSPCIDAVPAPHLTAAVDVDVDGDPRRIDGDLDGGTTNGAQPDMGADEFTEVRLSLSGAPAIGSGISFGFASPQPSLCFFAVADLTDNLTIEPFGSLLLGGMILVHAFSVTTVPVAVPIPNQPLLRGLSVHAQALITPIPVGPSGQFTNRVSITLF